MPKKTTDEYISQLANINPNILVLGEYTGNHNKIKVQCRECGTIFESDAANLLRGHGCKKCNHKKGGLKQRITNIEFLERLSKVNDTVEVLSKYDGADKKVKVRCLICGNEYETYPYNLLRGYKCMSCYRKSRFRTKEEFINEIKKMNSNIIVGDDFKHGKARCSFICKICGYITQTAPNNFLSHGCKCSKCAGNIMKTPDEYREYVLSKNQIIPLEDYNGVKQSISYKCLKCGQIWNETPEVLALRNYRCKSCESVISKLEDSVKAYLDTQNYNYEIHKKFLNLTGVGGNPLSYDFYISQYNLLIECQGKQHAQPIEYFGGEEQFKIQQEHDKRKREYADSNNYDFLEIWYYQNAIDILKDKLQIANSTK